MYLSSEVKGYVCFNASRNGRRYFYIIFQEGKKLIKLKLKKKPCAKCPYKLGMFETLLSPCPLCKLNGYDAYERFLKLPWQGKIPESKDK